MSQQQLSATDPAAGPVATGERFAHALAAKDGATLRGLLADPVDFQALTPRRHWQSSTPGEVVDEFILGTWFDAGDDIEALESVSSTGMPGRDHVSYRLRVRNADGVHLVEQQAYYNTDGERISWLRIMCSGYQKLPD